MSDLRLIWLALAWTAACTDSGGAPPPPPPPPPGVDAAEVCSAFTGDYSAIGNQETGSTCDPSMSSLSGAVTISGDATNGYGVALTVGAIDYSCGGIVTGCRWDATCTGTAPDGSTVRGMLTVTFTDTGFSGTMTEDFTGATNCHNQFGVTGTRS